MKNLLRAGYFLGIFLAIGLTNYNNAGKIEFSLANAEHPRESVYVFTGKVIESYIVKENGVLVLTIRDFQTCSDVETYVKKPVSVKAGDYITIFAVGTSRYLLETYSLSKISETTIKQAEKFIYTDRHYSNPYFHRCNR